LDKSEIIQKKKMFRVAVPKKSQKQIKAKKDNILQRADEFDAYQRLLDRYDNLWLDTTMMLERIPGLNAMEFYRIDHKDN